DSPPRKQPEPPTQQCPGILLHLTDSSANVKMRLDRSPCWYRAQRFSAAPKKLGTAQSLSSAENPGISLTAGDPPAGGPFEQRYQVLARYPEPVTELRGCRRAQLAQGLFHRPLELLQRLFQCIALLIHTLHRALARQVREQRRDGWI